MLWPGLGHGHPAWPAAQAAAADYGKSAADYAQGAGGESFPRPKTAKARKSAA